MIGQVLLISCIFAVIDSSSEFNTSKIDFNHHLPKGNKGTLLFPRILEEFLNEFRRPSTSPPHQSPTVPSHLPSVELPPPSESTSLVGQAISKIPAVQLPLQTARSPHRTTQQPAIQTQPSILSLLRAAQRETINSLNIFIPSDRNQLPRMNLMALPSLRQAPASQRLRSELSEILREENNASLNERGNIESLLIKGNGVESNSNNEIIGSPFISVLRALQPHDDPHNIVVNNLSSVSSTGNVSPLIRTHGKGESFQMEEKHNSQSRPSLTNTMNINHLDHPTIVSQILSLSKSDKLSWPRVSIASSNVQVNGHPSILDKENEIHDITIENEKNFKENPDITSRFSTILNTQGYKLDISNPEVDINNPNPTTLAQPRRGQKCISSARRNIPAGGVCVPLSECPALQSLQRQTQYTQIIVHLYENACRYEGKQVLFCCPFYSLSAALPGSLGRVSPRPAVSPVKVPIPRQGECGKVKVQYGKVIGGVALKDGQFPWLAAIGAPVSETQFQITCSGGLITKRHVITAAHCFYAPETENPTHVRLGETNVFENTRPIHRDYYIIAKNFPLYHKHVSINDVTLLTLDRDVLYDDYVQPGCLPFDLLESPRPGDTVTAVGYGRESGDLPFTAVTPNRVDIEVVENSFCQQAYYSSRNFPVIDHRAFCAGGQALMGTCEGDSGGPVHLFDPSLERYVIVGTVKGGGGCGSADLPSVNTRLVPFLPWIESVVKE